MRRLQHGIFYGMVGLLALAAVSSLIPKSLFQPRVRTHANGNLADPTSSAGTDASNVSSSTSKPAWNAFRTLAESPDATTRETREWLSKLESTGPGSDHASHPKSTRESAETSQSPVGGWDVHRDSDGTARLEWPLLRATKLEDREHASFEVALSRLADQPVVLSGFMTPLDDFGLVDAFLLVPYPVGCYYCQTPTPVEVVMVQLAKGPVRMSFSPVRIQGKLSLNRDDPDDFLYAISNATIEHAQP